MKRTSTRGSVVVPIERARSVRWAAVIRAIEAGDLRDALLACAEAVPETDANRDLHAVVMASCTFKETKIEEVCKLLAPLTASTKKGTFALPMRFARPGLRVKQLVSYIATDAPHRQKSDRRARAEVMANVIRHEWPNLPNVNDPKLADRIEAELAADEHPRDAVDKALRLAGATTAQRRKWIHRHDAKEKHAENERGARRTGKRRRKR